MNADAVEAVRLLDDPAVLHDDAHDVAAVLGGRDDGGIDHRLLDVVDLHRVGHAHGVVDVLDLAVAEVDAVDDGGVGGDDVAVEFAAEALLDDLHVEQAEEAAAEAEAEGDGAFGVPGEGGVVELELFEAGADLLVLVRGDGVEAAEDHRLDLAEAGERLGGGVGLRRDRVAGADVLGVLDGADDVADGAGGERGGGLHLRGEDADLLVLRADARTHEDDVVAGLDRAVDDAHVGDDAAVDVVNAVEDDRAQRAVGMLRRRGRDAGDDLLHEIWDAEACL